MDLKEEDILGDSIADHWYYATKARALARFLKGIIVPELLDVGAGSGFLAKKMLEAGVAQSALCVDPFYAAESDDDEDGFRIRFRRESDHQHYGLVMMIDVLEHVDDDSGLLQQYVDDLPSGGHLLVSVPAFQSLWSGHDVFLEHKRRYRLRGVEALLRDAGLEVVRGRYFFGALLPIVALMRLVDRVRLGTGTVEPASSLRQHSGVVNALLTGIHDFERLLVFPVNRLAGLSVFCLARKP